MYLYKESESLEAYDNYFKFNKDNPYAVYYLLTFIVNNGLLENASQFPPLTFYKDKSIYNERLSILIKEAEYGDLIYTFKSDDRMSITIREVDYSMWSHVGTILDNNIISEMTIDGYRENRTLLDFYDKPSYYLGLYRFRNFDDDIRRNMVKWKEEMRIRKPPYAFGKVAKAFLNHKIGRKLFKTNATIVGYQVTFDTKLVAYV